MRVLSLICLVLSILLQVGLKAEQESGQDAMEATRESAVIDTQNTLRLAMFGPEDEVAQLEAGMSGVNGLEIITRNDLRILLGEQLLDSLSVGSPAFGHLLGADVFLFIEPGPPCILRLVDADTGEDLGRSAFKPAAIVNTARTLLEKADRDEDSLRLSVAILDLDGPEVRVSGAVLREWLVGAEFRVLDRTLTFQVLDERTAKETGFRSVGEKLPPFPGASRLLQIAATADGIQITVLADDGSTRGRYFWKSAPEPDEDLERFLLDHLGGKPMDGLESMVEFRQRVNIEALLPFYEGVALFDSGQPLRAIIKFREAYEMNHLFSAAYLWEIRCYEAVGLAEFARALERWMGTGFSGRGVAAGGDVTPREGITFLGVTDTDESHAAATRLTLAAMDVLSGPDLILPASLAAIRDEYDLRAAASHGTGAQWTRAEGFVSRFTLRGRIVEGQCEWTLADDLAGKVLATAFQALHGTPQDWERDLTEILPQMLEQTQVPESIVGPESLDLPTLDEAREQFLNGASPAEQQVALLQMIMLNPGDATVIGAQLRKRKSERNDLESYFAQAKRATLLRTLSPDHPMRPWVELEEIQTFLPSLASGPHLSGQQRDSQEELKRFSEERPDHPARVLARFFWLTDGQASMPPEQLAAEAQALAPRMREARDVPDYEKLAQMCEALEWLGRTAAGEAGLVLDPSQTTPRAYRMEITEKAEIKLVSNDDWRVEDFRIFPLTPEEIVLEARAAIAIGGRAERKKNVEPQWLEESGGSFSMASFVGWFGLYEFGHPDGLPHPFPGDYEKLRAHWRAMIKFTETNLTKWLQRVETKDQFRAIDAPLQWFFPALAGGNAFLLEEEEFDAIHARLAEASAAAARRIGISDVAPISLGRYRIDWRDLTYQEARKQGADSLRGAARFMRDIPAFSDALHTAARQAFVDEFPSYREWWRLANWGLDEAMSNREFAARFVVPYLPDLLRTYGDGALSDDERAMLLDVAILLMWGWHYPEAENVIRLVIDAPPVAGSDPQLVAALTGLALLHEARLFNQAENRPSALQALQRSLQITEGLEVRNLWRIKDNFRKDLLKVAGQRNNLRSIAGRMLEELRFDPTRAVFPERVGAIQIPTSQLENAKVTVFFRTPPPSENPPQVLVILPSFNDGVAAICSDESSWARFADANNLVLVVPQFFQVHTTWKVDHPCSPYHFPQLWAGQVLLDAMDKIGQQHSLASEKLLFHGLGAGAQFAARFARWRPDRVGALSLHSGAGYYPWKEAEQGLQPLPVLAGLPVLLTIGAKDDEGVNFVSRRAGSETFHTVLQGVGADVEFHVIDTTFNKETPRLRELAEAFLHKNIKPQNP